MVYFTVLLENFGIPSTILKYNYTLPKLLVRILNYYTPYRPNDFNF